MDENSTIGHRVRTEMAPSHEDESSNQPITRPQPHPRTDFMPEIALAPTADLEEELSTISTSLSDSPRRTHSSSDIRYRHPTIGRRLEEHRLQHVHTVGSSTPRIASRQDTQTLPSFGRGRPYPKPLPEREEYVVDFDDAHDPDHPQNWPLKRKLWITAILVFDSLAATLASSIYSPASTAVEMHFHIGRETATLGTSLFVLGYALGPVCWAPLSELYGRRMPIITAAFGFAVFQIAVAVAKDTQTLMICRFFAGWMGACTLTVCPAVFADMYDNKVRGLAVAVFSGTIFNGPLLGPMIGGFITKSHLGWRWTQYIPALMGFAAAALALIYQQETYPPVVLVEKAARLRRATHNWGIHAKQEEVEIDIRDLVIKNVGRPIRILFTEPIVFLITLYMSFLYGMLYLSLTAYSIIFCEIYGFSLGVCGLPYIGMVVGVTLGLIITILLNPRYVAKLEANDDVPVPEWRLLLPMYGGICFAAGLFWLGWTGSTGRIHWIVPTLAGIPLGFGIYTVFLQLLNYIIDSYLTFAASAVAANTFLRSLFGAIFPLFAEYMYNGIGINWGMTVVGCVSILLVPMPFIFHRYGRAIRSKSKFAPSPGLPQPDNQRDEEKDAGEQS